MWLKAALCAGGRTLIWCAFWSSICTLPALWLETEHEDWLQEKQMHILMFLFFFSYFYVFLCTFLCSNRPGPSWRTSSNITTCGLISIWANKLYFPCYLNRKKWNKIIYLIAIDSGQQLGLQHEYRLSILRLWFLSRNQNTNYSKLLWQLLVFHETKINELSKSLRAAWHWL